LVFGLDTIRVSNMSNKTPQKSDFSQLPQVDKLIKHPELAAWSSQLLPQFRKGVIQQVLDEVRAAIKNDGMAFEEATLLKKIGEAFNALTAPALTRAINATGIILHTNLGRAPIGSQTLKNLQNELAGYCTLETDLETAGRGERTAQLESMLCALTGAEAALVVNNGAAAVYLILNTLSFGKETLISRGELVQIGGGFRMPDILRQSGAALREVGTTNITELIDYEKSVGPQTALLLKVHQSCFHLQGHTHSPALKDLAALAHKHQLPLAVDWGSGSLENRGEKELSIQELLHTGCDILSFSGDKLFGASQAGMIVGKRSWIQQLKKSPLYRALRLGKLDLFVLEDRIRNHLAGTPSPVQEFLDFPLEILKSRSDAFCKSLNEKGIRAETKLGYTPIGGGSTPDETLESCLIQVEVPDCEAAARKLAQFRVPIYVRKERGALLLDLRTVFPADEKILLEALQCLF